MIVNITVVVIDVAVIFIMAISTTVPVPSDTLRYWRWSPTPERYMSLRVPNGPGSGPPPETNVSNIEQH